MIEQTGVQIGHYKWRTSQSEESEGGVDDYRGPLVGSHLFIAVLTVLEVDVDDIEVLLFEVFAGVGLEVVAEVCV